MIYSRLSNRRRVENKCRAWKKFRIDKPETIPESRVGEKFRFGLVGKLRVYDFLTALIR